MPTRRSGGRLLPHTSKAAPAGHCGGVATPRTARLDADASSAPRKFLCGKPGYVTSRVWCMLLPSPSHAIAATAGPEESHMAQRAQATRGCDSETGDTAAQLLERMEAYGRAAN